MESSTRTARLAGMLILAGVASGCTTPMQPLAYTPISEIQPGPGLVTENGEFRMFSTRLGPGGLKDYGQKKDYADMSPAEAARQAAIAAQEAAAAAKRAEEAAARAAALAGG